MIIQDKVIELMERLSFLQGSQINNPSHETEQAINRLKEEIAAIRSTQDVHRSFAVERDAFLQDKEENSHHTAVTYRSGLRWLELYLFETQGFTQLDSVAKLHLSMFAQFPGWLKKQMYLPSCSSLPQPLAESSVALYATSAILFVDFLVSRRRVPMIDTVDIKNMQQLFRKETQREDFALVPKVPKREDVVDLLAEVMRLPSLRIPNLHNITPSEKARTQLGRHRNVAVILALISSGMRPSELVTLTRDNLDIEKHAAWVTGKGQKTRMVFFDTRTWDAINTYLELRNDEALGQDIGQYPLFCRHNRATSRNHRKPISVRSVQQLMDRLSKDAGVSSDVKLTPVALRHYFATSLLRHTGNLAVVQDALGHSSPETTRVYAEVSKAELEQHVKDMQSKEKYHIAIDDITTPEQLDFF